MRNSYAHSTALLRPIATRTVQNRQSLHFLILEKFKFHSNVRFPSALSLAAGIERKVDKSKNKKILFTCSELKKKLNVTADCRGDKRIRQITLSQRHFSTLNIAQPNRVCLPFLQHPCRYRAQSQSAKRQNKCSSDEGRRYRN